jgi:hypothetical protein
MSNRNIGSPVTPYLLLSGLLLGVILCWRDDITPFSWMGQRVKWQSLPSESPDSLTSQTHPENADSFTLPETNRAVVIDPITKAVTLEAIDSYQ